MSRNIKRYQTAPSRDGLLRRAIGPVNPVGDRPDRGRNPGAAVSVEAADQDAAVLLDAAGDHGGVVIHAPGIAGGN